jgi:hypothetical protein
MGYRVLRVARPSKASDFWEIISWHPNNRSLAVCAALGVSVGFLIQHLTRSRMFAGCHSNWDAFNGSQREIQSGIKGD